jgi:hypothetical protein
MLAEILPTSYEVGALNGQYGLFSPSTWWWWARRPRAGRPP